ncbi:MAG: cytochrome c maturation protein CcmE, partial [Leadbetterella sp.]
MKKSHIIALLVLAVGVFMAVSMVDDVGTYVAFKDAEEMAKNGNKSLVHVVGELTKDSQGNITGMVYEPKIDPNRFEFTMKDSLDNTKKIVYSKPKPQDLDKSEKIVIVGSMNISNNIFEANEILLKCPSKYNNNELKAEA